MKDPSFGSIIESYALGAKGAEIAISYPEEALTWHAFEKFTAARARRLISMTVGPDAKVAVALRNGAEHHVSTFAAWRAGATPYILPAQLPGREFDQLLALAAPHVLIRDDDAPACGIQQLKPDRNDAACALPSDLAATHWKAVASGGSTGRPKLIVDHAEARYGEKLQAISDIIGMPRHTVMLNPGPLYHNAPFLFTSLALLAGTRVVGMTRFDPEEALRLIEREQVEWVCLVPTMMHRILSLPPGTRARYDLSSLQRVVHLGAPCPAWLKRAWIDWLGADRILEIYAGTEGASTLISGNEWLRKVGSVGKPAPGALSVLDDTGKPCMPGVIGEIYFTPEAAHCFHYLGADMRLDGAGRLSLGDLGHLDEDGYLFLSDRRTDLIIRGGANIYPAEVESALCEHPAIEDAVVIGLPCADLGARVHAIVRTKEIVSAEVLETFVGTRIAGYKCPKSYEFVKYDLRDEAGKVRRAALRDTRMRNVGPTTCHAPNAQA